MSFAASPPSRDFVAPASEPIVTPQTSQQSASDLSSTSPILSTPSTSQPRRRRRIRSVYSPRAGSLYDVLHQHAGISLFIRPICWTDQHARILGADFVELPPCDTPLPSHVAGSPPSKGHMRPSRTIVTLSNALTEMLHSNSPYPVLNSTAVRTVLTTLWPETFKRANLLPEFNMFFGGRVYRDAVRAQASWNYPSSSPASTFASFDSRTTRPADSFNTASIPSSSAQGGDNLPMMVYIGRQQLAAIRRNLFRVAPNPNKSPNSPVHRLQQLRAKALVPTNADHDAHLVGIFLAMAQRHFYSQPGRGGRRDTRWTPAPGCPAHPTFHDLTLRILTTDTEAADFIMYTGHVSAKFLQRFHDPFQVPVADSKGNDNASGIKIEYVRVPIWPILGLRERLGKALGHDLVGEFDTNEIERWEEEDEEVVEEEADVKNRGGKRKREALVEVFNSSFEEESDTEQPLSGKRKCFAEGNAVGVVN